MSSAGQFFDTFADRFDTIYDGKRSPVMQWVDRQFRHDMFERFAIAFDFLGNLDGRTVLDIGCGSGPYIAEALRRRALFVTGIDPAPRMLALASQRVAKLGLSEKMNLIQGYFPQTSPQGNYDYAIVMGVMDYIEDAPKFLSALCPFLTRGIVCSFPSRHWFRTPFRKLRYQLRHCPVYFYTYPEIQSLARIVGDNYTITKIAGAGMDFVLCLTL